MWILRNFTLAPHVNSRHAAEAVFKRFVSAGIQTQTSCTTSQRSATCATRIFGKTGNIYIYINVLFNKSALKFKCINSLSLSSIGSKNAYPRCTLKLLAVEDYTLHSFLPHIKLKIKPYLGYAGVT